MTTLCIDTGGSPLTRSDADFIKKWGKRKAFHVGGNSSCRQHIRQHWDLYKAECEEKNLPVNHHAIPRHVVRQMEEEKLEKTKRKMAQSKLGFTKVTGPKEFTREGLLHAVSQLIATDDQVLASKFSRP